jgi:hypothetical protein
VLAPERNREHSIEDQVTALNVGFMERLQTNSVCRLINQHLVEHPQLLWPIGWAAENSCGLNGVGSEKVQLDYQSRQLKLELRFVG